MFTASSAIARGIATLQGDEVERKLAGLLHDDSVQVISSFELNQIASLTYHETSRADGKELCEEIVGILKEIVSKPAQYSPLTLHKACVVCKHILIFGAEKVIAECMVLGRFVEALQNYNTVLIAQQQQGATGMLMRIKGGGVDRGGPVREASGQVYQLLVNRNQLLFERAQQADPTSLVPVGDGDRVAFATDEVRLHALQKRMEEQNRIRIQSNLAKADGGFGGGYMSKDGKAVVGAAHGIEEMMKMANREKKKFSDDGTGNTGYAAPTLDDTNDDLIYGNSSAAAATGDLLSSGAISSQPQQQQHEADLLDFGGGGPTTTATNTAGIPSPVATLIGDPFAPTTAAASSGSTSTADLLGTALAPALAPTGSVSTTADLLSMMTVSSATGGGEGGDGSASAAGTSSETNGKTAEVPQSTGGGSDLVGIPVPAPAATAAAAAPISPVRVMGHSSNRLQDRFSALDALGGPSISNPPNGANATAAGAAAAESRILGMSGPSGGHGAVNATANANANTSLNAPPTTMGASGSSGLMSSLTSSGTMSASEAENRILNSAGGGNSLGLNLNLNLSSVMASSGMSSSMGSTSGPTQSMNNNRNNLPSLGLSANTLGPQTPSVPSSSFGVTTGAGPAKGPLSVNLSSLQVSTPSSTWGTNTDGDDENGFVMGGTIGSGLEPTGEAPAAPPPPPPPGALSDLSL